MKKLHQRKPAGESREQLRRRQTMRWKLTMLAFLIMLFSCLITVAVYYVLLTLLGTTPMVIALTVNPLFAAAVVLIACGIIAIVLFAWLSKYYLRPIKQLIHATEEVRKGNFEILVSTEARPGTEIAELIQNFNEMTQELSGIELFRSDFINNFSHEFKTPIVSIRGFARELQMEGLDNSQRVEYARIIEEESDRLVRLSSNILELSKLENQQILTDQTVFYLDEQIRQSILLLENEWAEKDLEILPELVGLRYYSNEEMLALVWRNLLSNAIKFTPLGGKIWVEMQVSPDHVTVSVRDNGIGMTPEVLSHVFEKFYQGDPSHSRKGYGVGLSVVQRAVTLCGGSITAESSPGNGSCFRVTLPLDQLPLTQK